MSGLIVRSRKTKTVQADGKLYVQQTNRQRSVLHFFRQIPGDQDQDLFLAEGFSSTEYTQSYYQDTEEGGDGCERERQSLSEVETTNSGGNR